MSQNSLYQGLLYQGLTVNDKTYKMSPLEKSRLTHHEMLEIAVCTYEKNITYYFLHDLDKNQIRLIFCILKSEISSQKEWYSKKYT